MRTLLIDDDKEISATVVARTIHDGVKALQEQGPFDELFLDYYIDNWARHKRTGMLVLHWLEHHPEFLPKKITPVSSDESRNKEMQAVIEELYSE